MKRTILGGLLAIAVFAVASLFLTPRQPAQASSFTANTISAATTTATFNVTTSVRVLATTTNPLAQPGIGSFTRIYATICNPNSNPVAILLNKDVKADARATVGRVTTFIAAAAGYEACYKISDANQYSGSVQASTTNNIATRIYVSDYVQ